MTFRAAALDFLQTSKIETLKNDKHRKQWRTTIEEACKTSAACLWSRSTAPSAQDALAVWKRTPETGSSLRGRLERVFAWAKPLGCSPGNPASGTCSTITCQQGRRRASPAMPYARCPGLHGRAAEPHSFQRRALEFTILTATRTSEAIGARWSEIDLDAGSVGRSRLAHEGEADHRVPLSDRAVELLRSQWSAECDRIFPLHNMAMFELLRGMAGNGYTVHGFRSAFTDWARDRTGYPRDLIEMALAHTIKDKSEAAYQARRCARQATPAHERWARYLEAPAAAPTT